MNIISEEDLKEIAEAAELVLQTCERIAELEGYIEILDDSNSGVKAVVGVIVSGLSSETHSNGQLYLDLGESHKPWVIQRLKEMAQEHKDTLLKIRPFYAKDEPEKKEI